MRLVLDTNVVISALLWSGPPRQLISRHRQVGAVLFSSLPMLAELTDVLGRTKFLRKIADQGLTTQEIIELFAQAVILVNPATVNGVAPDPDDDFVIGTAFAAQADLLVTGDRPLLSVRKYQSVQIVSVQQALEVLAAK